MIDRRKMKLPVIEDQEEPLPEEDALAMVFGVAEAGLLDSPLSPEAAAIALAREEELKRKRRERK